MEPYRVGAEKVYLKNEDIIGTVDVDGFKPEIDVAAISESIHKLANEYMTPEALADLLEGSIVQVQIDDASMSQVKRMKQAARAKGYKRASVGLFQPDGTRYMWLRKK